MNQILNFKNTEQENDINNIDASNYNVNKHKNKFNTFLKIQFVFSNIITIFFIYYFISYKISNNKQESISQKLLNDFSISNLYNSSNNYASEKVYYNYNNIFSFYIIGIIEIPKIDITYPIISEISDEFLKIAPCKFYGPELNEVGNVCIAAHNYDNNKFFSKINTLNKNDLIYIYNLNGEKQEYNVIKNCEIEFNDTSPTSQDTNGKQELTLITCNNLNNNRIIVKAVKK